MNDATSDLSRGLMLGFALLGLAVMASVAHAATIVVVNNDGAGEGFNDPTAAVPWEEMPARRSALNG